VVISATTPTPTSIQIAATITGRGPKARSAPPPIQASIAHEFAVDNAPRYFDLFHRARAVMPLFATLGGLAVFAWSRSLYGPGGGLLALALWCLCPNILAHSRLVTSDVGATSLGVAATYLFWRYLKSPTWSRAGLAGFARTTVGWAGSPKDSISRTTPLGRAASAICTSRSLRA